MNNERIAADRQREAWWKIYELEQRLEMLAAYASAELGKEETPLEGPFYQLSLAVNDLHDHARKTRQMLTGWDWA